MAGEALTDYASRSIFRFLTNAERFALQGKHPRLAALLGKQALACKASGNAYPTPLMVAVLAPFIVIIGESGVDLSQLLGLVKSNDAPETVASKILRQLKGRRRLVGKPKAKATHVTRQSVKSRFSLRTVGLSLRQRKLRMYV